MGLFLRRPNLHLAISLSLSQALCVFLLSGGQLKDSQICWSNCAEMVLCDCEPCKVQLNWVWAAPLF